MDVRRNLMQNNKLVLTVPETAEVLGISRGLAYDLIRRGTIPSLRLGKRIVVPTRALAAMIDAPPEGLVEQVRDGSAVPEL
jgi:excisionase family DNA binding protein